MIGGTMMGKFFRNIADAYDKTSTSKFIKEMLKLEKKKLLN